MRLALFDAIHNQKKGFKTIRISQSGSETIKKKKTIEGKPVDSQ